MATEVRLRGQVRWWWRDGRGRLLGAGQRANVVTNQALAALAQWAIGVTNVGPGAVPFPTQMQLGTGTGTPSATDTGLFAPAAGTLVAITNFTVYQTFYAQFLAYWGSTTPAGNYTEAGLLDPNGVLWAHVLLQTSGSQPYIPLQAGQTLNILWKLQFLGS